jgi:hypothetical protein
MPDAGGVAVEWFRFYNEVRVDRKLDTLTDAQFRVWSNLMCYAAEQKDKRGTIPPIDTESLAIECAKGDEELLASTIERLIKPLRIIEQLEDGSLHFINWEKRQPNSDNETERKRRYRSRECPTDVPPMSQQCPDFSSVSVSVSSSSLKEGDARGRDEYTPEFDTFWKLFPYRTGHSKKLAFKCWQARLKEGVSPADLHTAAANYAKEREGKDSTFTKMASTFLGPNEHWKAYLVQEERPIQQYPDPTEEYREEWERAGVNR